MNHAAEKAQPFGGVVAVPANVVLRDLCIQSEKAIHAPGFGEDVRRVTQLRGFHDHGFLNVENVLLPKKIAPALVLHPEAAASLGHSCGVIPPPAS